MQSGKNHTQKSNNRRAVEYIIKKVTRKIEIEPVFLTYGQI